MPGIRKVDAITLWSNAGTADLTLTSGTIATGAGRGHFTLSTPGNSSTGVLTESATIGAIGSTPQYWYEIPTNGIDYLIIQYMSQITNVGTITACTASELYCAAVGLSFTDDITGLRYPHPINAASTPSKTFGEPDWSTATLVTTHISWGKLVGDQNYYTNGLAQGWGIDNGGNPMPTARGALMLMGGIPEAPFAASRTPVASTDYPGWSFFVHTRTAGVTNQGVGAITYPRISGYEKVWLSFSHVTTFTAGGGPAFRAKGKIVAIRLAENPLS
jgi:hypothetical protein